LHCHVTPTGLVIFPDVVTPLPGRMYLHNLSEKK
jgi:hypothetical protein